MNTYYTVNNTVEDKIIFHGVERNFIAFMKRILKENEDEDMSILGVSDAIEYLEDYCDNLEMIADPLGEFKGQLKDLLEKYNASIECDIDGDTHGLINTMVVCIGQVDYPITGGCGLDWNDLK